MSIQAIETEYKGYKFRSRLEARWAVFFDALNVKFEYEPEGFENDSGESYLPDFYLPDFDIWCEVKPFDRSRRDEIVRASHFVKKSSKIQVLVFLPGIPGEIYENSLFWFRCVYYDILSRTTKFARIMFWYTDCGENGEMMFYPVGDFYTGRNCDVGWKYGEMEWDCIHDLDIPNEIYDAYNGYIRYSTDAVTPELNEAYKKARQARFGNAKKY